jgi:hypothetical protein
MSTIVSTDRGASSGAKIISLAEYRRRFATSDDDSDPPDPCAAAARPPADLMRMDATLSPVRRHAAISPRRGVHPRPPAHAVCRELWQGGRA